MNHFYGLYIFLTLIMPKSEGFITLMDGMATSMITIK